MRTQPHPPYLHHPEAHSKFGDFLKEMVFGFNDGVVSTFAVIAGLTGGAAENKTVLLAALATLFAGILSMGLGTYLGSKSEKELYDKERKRELHEIEHMPEIERQEIRDIYATKGFKGKLLEEVVAQITKDKHVWLKSMLSEELGFAEAPPRPGLNGLAMSSAFMVGSLLPTVPYFLRTTGESTIGGLPMIFALSLVFSIAGLLVAGGLKTRFTGLNVFLSALETLLVGAAAAGATYGVGMLFS